jgi:hypothetical protein
MLTVPRAGSGPDATAYQAKDTASAQTYSDAAAATTAAQGAAPVPGLPQSRWPRAAASNGLVPRYWCLATVGRYAIKPLPANSIPHINRSQRNIAC